MKNRAKKLVDYYKFNDDKNMIKVLIVSNLFFSILLSLPDLSNYATDLRIQICLFSGLFFLGIYKYYDWRTHAINVLAMLFYLFLFLIEFLYLGVPSSLLNISQVLTKGVMFEMLVSILPYVYMGIRMAIILPLIKILYSSIVLENDF